MDEDAQLPENVRAALHLNRKIDAIKLLREQRGIGLKEAKDCVEAYLDSLPPGSVNRPPPTDFGLGRVLIVALGAAAIYIVYRFLS